MFSINIYMCMSIYIYIYTLEHKSLSVEIDFYVFFPIILLLTLHRALYQTDFVSFQYYISCYWCHYKDLIMVMHDICVYQS